MVENKENRESDLEAERNVEQLLGELLKQHEARRERTGERGEAWLNDRVKDLPENARKDILALDASYAEDGLSAEKRAKYIDREILRYEQTYVDRRFDFGEGKRILKDAYAKEKTISWVKELLDRKPSIGDLKKIARLSFDANGLKAANDLPASHESGDEYLKRIALIFRDETSDARKRLKELGVTEFVPTTGGGDEYSVLLKFDAEPAPEKLNEAVRIYEKAVIDTDVSDLIDFKNLDVQLRFIGKSRQEYDALSDADKEAVKERIAKEIPAGAKFRGSASGGAATLFDGLRRAVTDPREKKRLAPGDDYDHALEKIMGGLWDASDNAAFETKTAFKEALRGEKASEEDRFLSKLLSRTVEARSQEELIGTLQKQALELGSKNKDLEAQLALYRSGSL